jgi:hypothetical protein
MRVVRCDGRAQKTLIAKSSADKIKAKFALQLAG